MITADVAHATTSHHLAMPAPTAAAAGASGAAGPLPRSPELHQWVNANAATTDRISDHIEIVRTSRLIVWGG